MLFLRVWCVLVIHLLMPKLRKKLICVCILPCRVCLTLFLTSYFSVCPFDAYVGLVDFCRKSCSVLLQRWQRLGFIPHKHNHIYSSQDISHSMTTVHQTDIEFERSLLMCLFSEKKYYIKMQTSSFSGGKLQDHKLWLYTCNWHYSPQGPNYSKCLGTKKPPSSLHSNIPRSLMLRTHLRC